MAHRARWGRRWGRVGLLLWLVWSGVAAAQYEAVGARTPFVAAGALSLADYCNGADTGDDTSCVQAWLNAGRVQGAHLFAPAGTYYVQRTMPLFDGIHLRCESPTTTVFRNTGNVSTMMALAVSLGDAGAPYDDVSVEHCGFDVYGVTKNFATAVFIGGTPEAPATHITLRGNRVFDSTQPGQMFIERDRQRQYLLVLAANDVLIEHNTLSEGGRIKVGRPGSRVVIRHNTLANVNDNGITVVNLGSHAVAHHRIEFNTIVNALGSGIFFGADGQQQGTAAMAVTDVEIRGNTIRGNQANCILGTLPNHAARILIEGNACRKLTGPYGYEAAFDAGIALIRNATSTLPATDITVRDNTLLAEGGEWWENGGLFTKAALTNVCILRNDISNSTGNGIELRAAAVTGALTGNTLHDSKVSLGTGVDLDTSGSTTGCFGVRGCSCADEGQ